MKKALRVLVVEDSEDDTFLLLRELEQAGFEVESERVETSLSMTAALENRKWDVIICDHTIPGFGSLQALELTKQKGVGLPFIVVSGTIGEETAVKVMKAGASDYVMKGRIARLGR